MRIKTSMRAGDIFGQNLKTCHAYISLRGTQKDADAQGIQAMLRHL